ncbi:DinB family protein [Thalassobacillus sp. CUG 92003]|uniref:DinB family protein n=1 Tax=Thalassobacillus sp. CUG 92003 TaxID=2736641 RepID=UPI0015E7127E|nr:DinB family protein [Thalassobacillus sp. CUG 92003]
MSKSKQFLDYFLSHRHVTNELIAKIDREHEDYKPTPTSMTARTLVTHMLTSFYQFAAAAAKQEPQQVFTDNASVELTELAQTYTDKTIQLIESMSDDDFDRLIDMTHVLGVELPANQVLHAALDHEINHKGNLFIYVREMGYTELPMFVKTG